MVLLLVDWLHKKIPFIFISIAYFNFWRRFSGVAGVFGKDVFVFGKDLSLVRL